MSDLHEIYVLSEELAEVISAIGKGRRFGWNNKCPRTGESNLQHLIFEIHDVLGCCKMIGVDYIDNSCGVITTVSSSTINRALSNLVSVISNTIAAVESYIVGSTNHSAFISELKSCISSIMVICLAVVAIMGGDISINRVLIDNKIAKVKKLKHLVS